MYIQIPVYTEKKMRKPTPYNPFANFTTFETEPVDESDIFERSYGLYKQASRNYPNKYIIINNNATCRRDGYNCKTDYHYGI